jgi:hypothetical protein
MSTLKAWKAPFFCALAITALPITLLYLADKAPAETGVPIAANGSDVIFRTGNAPKAAGGKAEITLGDALGRHWVEAAYTGDGHSEIRALITNIRGAPIRLNVDSGLVFENASAHNQMVVARGETVDLPADSQRAVWLQCAATRSANSLDAQPYWLCSGTLPALRKLFEEVDRSPEYSREAVQAAVLLLTENAPLSLFAEFSLLTVGPVAKPPTAAYQTNTAEILSSFELLYAAGYSRQHMPAAHDPQLKAEAMIDPLAHSEALHFYRIAPSKEWAFWRDELQAGDPAIRHYALYGIGRYYPEVALQMLPNWARSAHLNALLRLSAIQAMAETHRAEAIPALEEMEAEFGATTELGQSAHKAIAYLQNQSALPMGTRLVEFRVTQANLR